MEFLVEHLTLIFCYFTGMLTAWSLYLSYEHYKIITIAKIIHKRPRKCDTFQMIGLFVASLFLTLSLFAFPNTVTRFLDMLFVLELWYTVYLFYVSANVYKSLKYINKVTTVLESSKHMGHVL